MTDKEKEDVAGWDTVGGYLKTLTHKEAWAEYWDRARESDKKFFLSLPNFNAEMFEEITGIDVEVKEKMVEVDGKEYSESTIKKELREYVG